MSKVLPEWYLEKLKSAKPLQEFGVNNWGFERNKAIEVAKDSIHYSNPILGGDVYDVVNGIPELNYDSWHCEPILGESKAEYAARCAKKTIDYIESYECENGIDVLFVLVVESEIKK